MSKQIIMPALGMSQDTGVILEWKKSLNDSIAKGEILVEIETDKSTVEIESEVDGFLTNIHFETGAEVPVGEIIAVISNQADTTFPQSLTTKVESNESEPSTPTQQKENNKNSEQIITQKPKNDEQAVLSTPVSKNSEEKLLFSPKARIATKSNNLSPAKISKFHHGKSPLHFVDVQSYLEKNKRAADSSTTTKLQAKISSENIFRLAEWSNQENDFHLSDIDIAVLFLSDCWRKYIADESDKKKKIVIRLYEWCKGSFSKNHAVDCDLSGWENYSTGLITSFHEEPDDWVIDFINVRSIGLQTVNNLLSNDSTQATIVIGTESENKDTDYLYITMEYVPGYFSIEQALHFFSEYNKMLSKPIRFIL